MIEPSHNSRREAEREQLLANLVARYADSRLRGEAEDPESYCRAYPDLEPELRAQIEALDELDTMLLPEEISPPAEMPDQLSGMRIVGEIGRGGMGRVLLADDERLGRKVAVKTLNPRYADNARLRSRFMSEARALARLSHPNVVRIYNLGDANEEPHFVMEYVEGVPLTEAARRLAMRQKIELMRKVVQTVDFLHQHQVIHRDLKPGNILVGPDLEPKLLDFGLALQRDELGTRLTMAGEILGTPDYFSPEQAKGTGPLDARSDVFSLGTILYELLTDARPFRGEEVGAQIELICDRDPVLPRRINSAIPGELQNICLKALEKDRAHRYQSAREMAEDLTRYLAGEAVLAVPSSYARMIGGKVEQHIRELGSWRQDSILSEHEFDAFRKLYDRLFDREDAWILELRRLSFSQVSLYLGGWLLVTGAMLLLLFRYIALSGAASVALVFLASGLAASIGIREWKRGRLQIGVAFLLAFCLLLPTLFVIAANTWGWFAGWTRGREDLELFNLFSGVRKITNAQLWWALLLSLPAHLWLRRFTRASVFSLVIAVMSALLGLATLLRMGLIEWFDADPGKVYFYLLPIAALFFIVGLVIERTGFSSDSRYFYPFAVGFTFIALSGVAAFHQPYADWLRSVAPFTRGQVKYLFIINALIYLGLQYACERMSSPQTRSVAHAFRFVIPGHVMTSLLLLGMAASDLWARDLASSSLRFEARFFEILLPIVACLFVFGSVPKQMKNFFVTGLLFLAIGIVRLQMDLFKDRAAWPLALLLLGLLFMLAAANLDPLKRTAKNFFGR